jgi:predicted nuclease of predicted toxin-antitoxin system
VKVKLDENLPGSAAEPLRAAGHDVDIVRAEGLQGEDDSTVLAQRAGTDGCW